MSPVTLEKDGNVAIITVDNPPVNALSHAVRDGLMSCVTEADEDETCAAIIILCAGRTFIAGADIKEFGKPHKDPSLPDVVRRIEDCGKPVIAAIHGTSLGGGFEVAMGCHYRIAAQSGAVGLPEVHLGLLPGATGTQRLPRLVGADVAMQVMLDGKPIKAPAALKAGAIDQVATSDDLRAEAIEFAKECVAQGVRRIRDLPVPDIDPSVFDATRKKIAAKTRGLISPEMIIRAVELSTELDFEDACAKEREFFQACMASEQSAGLRHAFFAEREVSKVPGIDKETARRDIASIAVIGAGTMGAGIAYAALTSGFSVTLLDNNEEGLARGEKTIRGYFQGGVDRGKISADAMQTGLERFSTSHSYDQIADVDLVIEAVFESMAIKKDVFAELDKVVRAGAILATNTSTLDVDEIAGVTARPEDVIGLHFFSPAHIMRLLEIVRGEQTSPEVIATSLDLAKRLRKIGVVVGNCYGFVGNRMLHGYGREAQFLLLEGAAPEQIDKALFDFGMAMGPHAVGDLAGLDVGYKTRQERDDLPDDPRFYRIADLLSEMGRHGQKTGKGIYLYEDGSRTPVPDPEVAEIIASEAQRLGVEQRDISDEEIVERCVTALILEGARILEEGIAVRSGDIDVVWMNGYGFPRHRGGPMHYADTLGADKVYAVVCDYEARFGAEYWRPSKLLKKLAEEGGRFSDI